METKEAIRRVFMRLYVHKRLDRITVKGLCAEVPVARTTFYNHYRNVDDVLVEVEDLLLSGLADVTERVSGGDLPSMDFGAFLNETFAYIVGNWDDFHALLLVQPDSRFIARWKAAVKANFAKRYPRARMQPNWDLLAEMAAAATIGAYAWWMERPDQAGVEDAKRLVERALTGVMATVQHQTRHV